MSGIIKRIWSGFLQSLVILATGSLIAQLMVAGEQLILPRIFTAEVLGIYTFLIAFPQACIGTICGRYDLTLVYEEDEGNIFALVKLNMLLCLLLSTVLSIGYGAYLYFFRQEYRRFLYLIPAIFLYLFSYGITSMLNSYNNRYRQYKTITQMHLLRTFAQCFGTVGLGVLFAIILRNDSVSLHVSILVIPYCMGMFFGVTSQAKLLLSHRKEIAAVSLTEVWKIAVKHKKQPLVSAPAIFANGFSYSLVTMMINNLFGATVTGYYGLSTKLLGMPITLISGNLSKVYMEEAAREYKSTGRFTKAFNKSFLFLTVMAIPMFLCMYYLAPPVCGFLFGSKDWQIAGEYIRILSPMFTLRFVATALSPGLYVCKKQGLEFVSQVSLLVVTAISGVISAMLYFDVEEFLFTVSIARSVVLLGYVIIAFYCSRKGND